MWIHSNFYKMMIWPTTRAAEEWPIIKYSMTQEKNDQLSTNKSTKDLDISLQKHQ